MNYLWRNSQSKCKTICRMAFLDGSRAWHSKRIYLEWSICFQYLGGHSCGRKWTISCNACSPAHQSQTTLNLTAHHYPIDFTLRLVIARSETHRRDTLPLWVFRKLLQYNYQTGQHTYRSRYVTTHTQITVCNKTYVQTDTYVSIAGQLWDILITDGRVSLTTDKTQSLTGSNYSHSS